MTAKTKKKAAKKKTARQVYEAKTQAVSVRVDPVVKYALDLMSRAQRRSVSSVIEWAIVEASKKTSPGELFDMEIDSVKGLADKTYSPNELERIVRLGMLAPDLLDFDERRIWTVMELTPEFWLADVRSKVMHSPKGNLSPNDFDWWSFRNNINVLDPIIREWAEKDPVGALPGYKLEQIGWEGEILNRPLAIPF